MARKSHLIFISSILTNQCNRFQAIERNKQRHLLRLTNGVTEPFIIDQHTPLPLPDSFPAAAVDPDTYSNAPSSQLDVDAMRVIAYKHKGTSLDVLVPSTPFKSRMTKRRPRRSSGDGSSSPSSSSANGDDVKSATVATKDASVGTTDSAHVDEEAGPVDEEHVPARPSAKAAALADMDFDMNEFDEEDQVDLTALALDPKGKRPERDPVPPPSQLPPRTIVPHSIYHPINLETGEPAPPSPILPPTMPSAPSPPNSLVEPIPEFIDQLSPRGPAMSQDTANFTAQKEEDQRVLEFSYRHRCRREDAGYTSDQETEDEFYLSRLDEPDYADWRAENVFDQIPAGSSVPQPTPFSRMDVDDEPANLPSSLGTTDNFRMLSIGSIGDTPAGLEITQLVTPALGTPFALVKDSAEAIDVDNEEELALLRVPGASSNLTTRRSPRTTAAMDSRAIKQEIIDVAEADLLGQKRAPTSPDQPTRTYLLSLHEHSNVYSLTHSLAAPKKRRPTPIPAPSRTNPSRIKPVGGSGQAGSSSMIHPFGKKDD